MEEPAVLLDVVISAFGSDVPVVIVVGAVVVVVAVDAYGDVFVTVRCYEHLQCLV